MIHFIDRSSRLTQDLQTQQQAWDREREMWRTQTVEWNKVQEQKDSELLQLQDQATNLKAKCMYTLNSEENSMIIFYCMYHHEML